MENKADRLILLGQKLANATENFLKKKGAGAGDLATNAFMERLRELARKTFGKDYAEPRVCGENKLAPDFYFDDEQTVVEFAFGLANPNSEYEKDILKCLLAQARGNPVRKLIFVTKPGAEAKVSEPGRRAIKDWCFETHQLEIEILELQPES